MNPSSVPPRFVPTLTEVVHPSPVTAQALPLDDSIRISALPLELKEQMVQRVLQRVDLMLERRLREAVGQLILEHTQTLVPRLREEIETVVRQSVNQALEQEIVQATTRS
jgi:tRNA A37 N6-isopentenylltransferase MiaA